MKTIKRFYLGILSAMILLLSTSNSFIKDVYAEDKNKISLDYDKLTEEEEKPNILFILADDMGFSDLGCYGSEIETPNLDRLAQNGVRMTGFTNTARCAPSRASILTGQSPYNAGIPNLPEWDTRTGAGYLSENVVTIPEVLGENGYETFMAGKWHLSKDLDVDQGNSWPLCRGFDKFYGTIPGGGSFFEPIRIWDQNTRIDELVKQDEDYYYTDAISDKMVEYIEENAKGDQPFFGYVAYTAPHFPLHAKEEDILKYEGVYDCGWDVIREQRFEKQKEMGLIDPSWELAPTHEYASGIQDWEDVTNKEYYVKSMQVYAAMIDCMDQGIGRILNTLEETGEMDNTVIIFMSDNGSSAEVLANQNYNIDEIGTDKSYNSVGAGWAQASATPFALFKKFTHNGGIATPFIFYWEKLDSIEGGEIRYNKAQIHDIMPTILELTGSQYPETYNGHEIMPLIGDSIMPIILNDDKIRNEFFWEHEESMAVQIGDWKLVKVKGYGWELYNLKEDGTESHNLIDLYPQMAEILKNRYVEWSSEQNSGYGDNLMVNGNFENSARYGSKHDGWSAWAPNGDLSSSFVEKLDVYEGEWRLTHYSGQPFTIFTGQTLKGMQSGKYIVSAKVMRCPDEMIQSCFMSIKNYGGEEIKIPIPASSQYITVSASFVCQTNTFEIGFYTQGNGGAWVAIDDVQLYLDTPI